MIAFGTAVADHATYEAIALPSIERVAEPDSLILARVGYDSIQQPYNEMMDEAAAQPGLEALILLHEDLELADPELPARVRRAFRDPRVGLLGALGGRLAGVHTWLEPLAAFGFAIGPEAVDDEFRLSTGPHEVDAVDGALIVVAPWVVRSIRFGEALAAGFHGYDVDIGARVRARRGTVVCEDIRCHHHMEVKGDYERQRAAGAVLASMWEPAVRPREWAPAFQC